MQLLFKSHLTYISPPTITNRRASFTASRSDKDEIKLLQISHSQPIQTTDFLQLKYNNYFQLLKEMYESIKSHIEIERDDYSTRRVHFEALLTRSFPIIKKLNALDFENEEYMNEINKLFMQLKSVFYDSTHNLRDKQQAFKTSRNYLPAFMAFYKATIALPTIIAKNLLDIKDGFNNFWQYLEKKKNKKDSYAEKLWQTITSPLDASGQNLANQKMGNFTF